MELVVKNVPAYERDIREVDLIPGPGISPVEERQLTPVVLPGESPGQRSLVGNGP